MTLPIFKSFVNQFGYDESLVPLIKEEKDDEEDVTIAKKDPKTGSNVIVLQKVISGIPKNPSPKNPRPMKPASLLPAKITKIC